MTEDAAAAIAAILTDTRELTKELARIEHAVSVWRAFGRPVTKDGLLGAERGILMLLPLKAESGDACRCFSTECSRTDGIEYEKAHVLRVEYIGWVWLPWFPLAPEKPGEKKPEAPE